MGEIFLYFLGAMVVTILGFAMGTAISMVIDVWIDRKDR